MSAAKRAKRSTPAATTDAGRRVEESLAWLQPQIKQEPYIGIICGSGLGGLADHVKGAQEFDYKDIPNFSASTVAGHAGKLVVGKLGGVNVIVMKGRIHCYEGHDFSAVALPVRVMCRLGIKVLLVTNAAGALNRDYRVGDLMLLKDHINFPGFAARNPLVGPHDPSFGDRFVGMSRPYNRFIRNMAKAIIQDLGQSPYLHEGVYAMVGGPTYETPTESRFIKMAGADCVGMSTVPEVIVAVQEKVLCMAMSLVTNCVVLDNDSDIQPNHEEVQAASKAREPHVQALFAKLCTQLKSEEASIDRELRKEGREE